ncbi:hypothetical protein IGS67_07290 [Flavimobilis sp. GY10621]|uniref:Lipoprotein n=1 Tax=Flavimobilis rhizosphaerae TaxID=2775421 RepID=A0ABR9DQS1_9MICO|nr:hypothetical protein [Flavimobilis rhizosphaerae]MBD9699294.1 hypothetical protein [Flavimobilis rhizosphaerae]
MLTLWLAVSLTACTGPKTPDPTAAYTPPAWMAQKVELAERQAVVMERCLRDAGLDDEVSVDAGTVGASGRHETEALSPEEQKARVEARVAIASRCSEEAQAAHPSPPETREQDYVKMTQTAECIRASGYPEIGQPPSRDTWIDTYDDPGSFPWSGYGELYRLHPDITERAWSSLRAVCAEGGVSFSLSLDDRRGAQ